MTLQHFLTEKKVVLLFFSCLFLNAINCQLITDEQNDKGETEKTELLDEIFFGTSLNYTYRNLTENLDFFGANMTEKDREEPTLVASFNLGIRSHSNKLPIFYGLGVSFLRNGVNYAYSTEDSTYTYAKNYRYLSFPIQIGFTQGENGFYSSVALSINHLFSSKNEIRIIQTGKFDQEFTEITKVGYHPIHLFGHLSLGYKKRLGENYGFYSSLDYYHQFNNTYVRQAPYIRREYGLGLNLGFHIYL